MPDPANYTNQTAIHEARTLDGNGKPVTDGFGKPVFGSPATIAVRKTPAKGVVRSATGTDVAVETEYRTTTQIKLQDKLDGSIVRRVGETILKDGTRFWYKAAV